MIWRQWKIWSRGSRWTKVHAFDSIDRRFTLCGLYAPKKFDAEFRKAGVAQPYCRNCLRVQ